MKTKVILNELAQHKGQNLKAVWKKQLRVRKGITNVVTKLTEAIVRGGIDYDNRLEVQLKREVGELPAENQGLPWGEWVVPHFVITHKGKEYVRLYPNSFDVAAKVRYFLDGEEVLEDVIAPLVLASELPKRDEKPLCFTLGVDNLVLLGNVVDTEKVKIEY